MDKKLPIIFILDLDRTLIGDPKHILAYKNTIEFIKNAKLSGKISDEEIPSAELNAIPNWRELFTPEMYRPGLKTFLEDVKKFFGTAEFFIYSAGTKEYVADIISILEKTLDVKFNRPLFSRTECPTDEQNHYTKSILTQFPKMIKALSKLEKYDAINLEEYTEEIMENRVVFLDDIDFVWDRKEKLVKAPAYNYTPMFDVDDRLLRMIFRTPIIQEYLRSSNANQTIYIHDKEAFNYDDYRMNYHIFMANIYREQSMTNRKAHDEDDFFARLVKAMKPYKSKPKPFKTAHLLAIQKEMGRK
jgi:hypothetical protein